MTAEYVYIYEHVLSENMETKRKPSSNVLKGNEKRPRRLSNDLSSSSPATSDLFESDLDVLEETLINTEKKAGKEKTGTSFGSPPTSDLFEPEVSERDEASPLNTSEIFEPLQCLSDNEYFPSSSTCCDDGPLKIASQDNEDDIGCVPLEDSEEEEGRSLKGKSSLFNVLRFLNFHCLYILSHNPGTHF